MIPESELAQIREDAEEVLQATCSILVKQTEGDGGGGTRSTWTPGLTGVPCRIAPVGGGVGGIVGEQVSDETTHVVTLPASTAIAKTSRIAVDGAAEAGLTGLYGVTAIHRRTFDEFVRRVEVKEVS